MELDMFERFTYRVIKVLALAHREAQIFKKESIGTEHILLGILREKRGVAYEVLEKLGVDIKKIERETEALIKKAGASRETKMLPQRPESRTVIERAIDEAKLFKHNYLGTGEILLGLLREKEGQGGMVLRNYGLELLRVREVVSELEGDEVPLIEKRSENER